MDLLGVLQLVVMIILAIWVAIWDIYQIRATKKLEQKVHRLNTGLDQSIQILHRAREAVIQRHMAYMFLLQYTAFQEEPAESYFTKQAELSAHDAELRGLASAIGDEELLQLVNEGYGFPFQHPAERNNVQDEAMIRINSKLLHTRISRLLEIATQ